MVPGKGHPQAGMSGGVERISLAGKASRGRRRLVLRVDFVQEATHGALNFAVRLERTLDNGPVGIFHLETRGSNRGDFVFDGADHVSETEATCL